MRLVSGSRPAALLTVLLGVLLALTTVPVLAGPAHAASVVLSGRITGLDASGASVPVQDVFVEVNQANGDSLDPRAYDYTAADGTYSITVPATGTYQVSIECWGDYPCADVYAPEAPVTRTISASTTLDADLDRWGRITGTVRKDGTATAWPNGEITANNDGRDYWSRLARRERRRRRHVHHRQGRAGHGDPHGQRALRRRGLPDRRTGAEPSWSPPARRSPRTWRSRTGRASTCARSTRAARRWRRCAGTSSPGPRAAAPGTTACSTARSPPVPTAGCPSRSATTASTPRASTTTSTAPRAPLAPTAMPHAASVARRTCPARPPGGPPRPSPRLKQDLALPVAGKSMQPAEPWTTGTGVTAVGTPITVDPGTWSPAETTLAWQWKYWDGTQWVAIAGATSPTYTPTADLTGKRPVAFITGTAPGYAPATQAWGNNVVGGKAPTMTGSLSITGPLTVGSTATANAGTFTPASTSTRLAVVPRRPPAGGGLERQRHHHRGHAGQEARGPAHRLRLGEW
ncbi:hypothetical protein G5V59_05730 [Nocardioides sp. W3-2-3]|uniref:hypothetical protein n=1 Tax=Nocardioides convexus TaxID=2712224 RepID=UPI002418ACF9|nr:hypothetical protein [Nocardioides convexus]NGZ99924.1 hypothetical protein [Nocardioides convexus]